MKKILLTSVVLCAAPAFAWNVITEPTAQSALIEEFTGIHCPNCPDGHRVATEMMNLHPGDVFAIAVHAGGFAVPSGKEPNYTTELSTNIHDHFGISSYPSGIVSRQDGEYGLVMGRGNWGPASREVIKRISPVNIWTGCTYDEDTRTVTLEVETYMTEAMTDPRLNVFLLQSEILGPQSGGQLGNEYPHRHMLRARLTDADFGDPIDKKAKGEYYSRTFTYTLPADIDGIEVDPRNVELITFVTDGENNVRKVCGNRLDTPGHEPYFSVSATAPYLPIEKNYAFDYVEVWLNNHGGSPVTTSDFDITLNGEKRTYTWNGELPPHTNSLVRVPLNGDWKGSEDLEDNSYVIRLTKANGREVDNASIRGKFNEIAGYPATLKFKIKTDLNASDNTYRILDTDGNVVHEFGPYEDGKAEEYAEEVTLENDRIYCFEVTDSWGDGVKHPVGSVKIYNEADKMVTQYREIGGYGMRQFFRTDDSLAVEDIQADETVKTEYFDLTGRRLEAPIRGRKIIRQTKADGTVSCSKSVL